MKKLLLLTATAFAAALSSAMVMKMYYPDGSTQRFNVSDVDKVSCQGSASSRKIVVEYASQADTLPAVADSVVFLNDEIHTANGHEYVDLGLSYLWATNNIGATDSSLGGHYAWAETDPVTDFSFRFEDPFRGSGVPDSFNVLSGKGFYLDRLNKYSYYGGGCVYDIFSSRYNRQDGLMDLLPSDDAAYVKWGPMWSTPSKEAWDELIENCTFKFVENYLGKSGYVLTSTVAGFEDKSIFFPVHFSSVNYKGPLEQSVYWTSTREAVLGKDYQDNIWGICFPTHQYDDDYQKDQKPKEMSSLFSRNMVAQIRPVIRKRAVEKFGLKSAGANNSDTYKVVYLNTDKISILKVEDVPEGKAAKGIGDLVDKIQKPQENLLFNGWSEDLTAVDRHLTVYPVFVVDSLHTYYKVRVICPDSMPVYGDFDKMYGDVHLKYILPPATAYDSIYVREGEDVPTDWLENRSYRWKDGYHIKHGLKLTDLHADVDITFDRAFIRDYSEQKGDHRFVDLGLSVNWASENLSQSVLNLSSDSLYNWSHNADVVTKIWGADWRLPSKEEFQELLDNCYVDKVTSVFNEEGELVREEGYLFTSKVPGYEGRTIFLPAWQIQLDCGPEPSFLELEGDYPTSDREGLKTYTFIRDGLYLEYFTLSSFGRVRAVTAK